MAFNVTYTALTTIAIYFFMFSCSSGASKSKSKPIDQVSDSEQSDDIQTGDGDSAIPISCSPGEVIRLTENLSKKGSAEIASINNELMLAWKDNRDGNYEIYLATLDAQGAKSAEKRLSHSIPNSGPLKIIEAENSYAVFWLEDDPLNSASLFLV